jgi:hypothetical protein
LEQRHENFRHRGAIGRALDFGLSGTAQQPDALQVNASYQCSNGMTVTITRCEKQNGLENCEFTIEQNGKLTFQG